MNNEMEIADKMDLVLSIFNRVYDGQDQRKQNEYIKCDWHETFFRLRQTNDDITLQDLLLMLDSFSRQNFLNSEVVRLNPVIDITGLSYQITLEGKVFIENGGFVSKVKQEKRQSELRVKQDETIEYNHKLAKMNLENYVPDRWKFWIPLGISLCAFIISGYGTLQKSNSRDIVISKTGKELKVDTLFVVKGKSLIDSTK